MFSFVLAAIAAVQPAQATPPALGQGRVQERAAVAGKVQALFARIDSNRDGFVTSDETHAARGLHKQNRGQRAEQRRQGLDPARQQQRRMAAFDRMDANRDGTISRAEFTQASAMRAERRTGRRARGGAGQMGMGARMFEMADTNRDGRVSLQEATAAAYQRFDMADLNRDGRLTREERSQGRERWRATPPRG
jgi:Ca2+-binding EF-hand superfamily protein